MIGREDSVVSDVNQERQFTEEIVNQRVNFTLLFYALVVGGALNSSGLTETVLLFHGFAFAVLLALASHRAQRKQQELFKLIPPTHPARVVDSAAPRWFWVASGRHRPRGIGSSVGLVGYGVPWLSVLSLLVLALLSAFNIEVLGRREAIPVPARTQSTATPDRLFSKQAVLRIPGSDRHLALQVEVQLRADSSGH